MSFPNESTTGVRDGVTLSSSGAPLTLDTAGAVVSGLDIDGEVIITASNVTLVDCRVSGLISIQGGTGAVIDHVDATGGLDIEGDNATVRFCDISGVENGIWLEADGALIEENYIHNLVGSPEAHIDGIQIPGTNIGAATTENCIIRHNNIDLDVQTASSCITMADAFNIDIIDNHLSGGSYVLYFGGTTVECNVDNNVFGAYAFGYIGDPAAPNQEYSGNVDESGNLLDFNNNGGGGGEVAGSVSIGDASVIEGNNGTRVEVFTVTRSDGTLAFDVHYATSNGSATVGNKDYFAASGTLHFAAGDNVETISVTIRGDTKVEPNETFNVVLSNPTSGATIADGHGIGAIVNDDGRHAHAIAHIEHIFAAHHEIA
jgi:hypothetical protein